MKESNNALDRPFNYFHIHAEHAWHWFLLPQ